MLKFRTEEGFTLIELLVVIVLVGVVASISVPVISNVIQGAQTDADATSAAALANFRDEYANFNIVTGTDDDAGFDIAYTDVDDDGVVDPEDREVARIANS